LSSAERTLTSLLDYSRLDGGTEFVRREHFHLETVVRPLVNDFAIMAAKKGLHLRVLNCDHIVMSDAHLLRRVLQNFLSNAVRYTLQGRVVLGCHRAGERLLIHVLDTGPGIPAELHSAVFQEYRQFPGDERVARMGLGLGLAIAKRISLLLDHPIALRSIPGRGSDFSISVPLGRVDQTDASRPSTDDVDAGTFTGKTVYCVEDKEEVLGGLEALLASWGCKTQGYTDAVRALGNAPNAFPPPDLVIVDYHLGGGFEGLDVATKLKAIWGKKVPVIVVTAADLRDHHLREDDGVVRIMRKPIRPGALRALMDVVLS
jgi:CheY-like chemotaxis protein/anti-sigma regulatory factor (Ser/Thr protein kinase)